MQEIKLEGILEKDKVIIKENWEELYNSGWYGKLENGKLELDLIEAALLSERLKLEIFLNGKQIDFKELYIYCSKHDSRFFSRYNVYKDLRERGLPVRIGFKGSDFRVYDRGAKPDKNDNIKWIVFTESEDYPSELKKLNKAIKLAENIRALALWAVVDNDGDTTYYIIQHKVSL